MAPAETPAARGQQADASLESGEGTLSREDVGRGLPLHPCPGRDAFRRDLGQKIGGGSAGGEPAAVPGGGGGGQAGSGGVGGEVCGRSR